MIRLRSDETHLGYAPERENWDAAFAARAQDDEPAPACPCALTTCDWPACPEGTRKAVV